jgi:hypothetical protein
VDHHQTEEVDLQIKDHQEDLHLDIQIIAVHHPIITAHQTKDHQGRDHLQAIHSIVDLQWEDKEGLIHSEESELFVNIFTNINSIC